MSVSKGSMSNTVIARCNTDDTVEGNETSGGKTSA